MAKKEYLRLPADCKDFTMESFDKLKDFGIVVIEDNEYTTEDQYLCVACRESDCAERKADSRDCDLPELKVKR